MRTSFEMRGGEPWFVIYELDEAYHEAARKLGYQEVGEGFGSVAPRDNPFLPRAYQNFQRYVEPMILQAAGALPVPWERALLDLLQILDGQGLDWWLLGSAALAARRLPVRPGDIDLVTSDEDAFRLEGLLLDYVVQPVIASPGWVHNSFARAFMESRVEWVGGVCAVADEAYPSDQGPIAAGRLEVISWRGYEIRVPPLQLQLEVCRQRGLTERAAIIERVLA